MMHLDPSACERRASERRGSDRRASDIDPSIGEPTFDELLQTLSSQKDTLRESQAIEGEASALRLRRALAKETPPRRQLAQSSSAPVLGLEKNSAWSTGCSYSFGKPRHRKGKYGIQVCEPRDVEYAQARLGGGYTIPGVGHYDLIHTSPDGLPVPDVAQGKTGGWPASRHEIFIQTLRESRNEATPEFFRLLRQRLSQVPFCQICDHVRWYALREQAEAQKLRRIVRWRTEQDIGAYQASAAEAKEREGEKRRLARLLRRADEAEAEEGDAGRPRAVLMRNRQLGPSGEELDANLTGHPEFRRSPSYTFGASRDPRDYAAKRLTHNAHVRSTSALDNPGPGSYCGLDEKVRLMKTVPSWSMRPRLDVDTNDPSCPDQGPGYHGRLEGKGGELAWRRAQEDLRTIQIRKPTWRFGTEAQRFEKASSAAPLFTDLRTPDSLGPGSYIGRGPPGGR